MAPPMANNPPTLHRRRINRGSPRSRAINPVVVKIPPPMMLLTRRQLAVNQPMVWYGLSEVWLGSDARVMSASVYAAGGDNCEQPAPFLSGRTRIPYTP